MAVNVESANLILRLWFLMHRDVGLFRRCEDQAYGQKGLTMERFTVLAAMRYLGSAVRPTDVAAWIGLSANSVSMIIDRMVEAGLVKRTRDRKDRRVVRLVATDKANDAFEQAIPMGWEFIHKIMSPLSQADMLTFARLLETTRYETLKYLYPGENIEAMVANDDKSHVKMMERLFHNVILSARQAKRRGAKTEGPCDEGS
jgi:DNA-binding MarR family transcriptional regulator